MRDPVLPTVDGPLEAWCAICASRNLPPDRSYCAECRPLYQSYQVELRRKSLLRLGRALLGIQPASARPLASTVRRARPE